MPSLARSLKHENAAQQAMQISRGGYFSLYIRPVLSSREAVGLTARSLHQCCRAQCRHTSNRVPREEKLDLCLQATLVHGSAVGTATLKQPKINPLHIQSRKLEMRTSLLPSPPLEISPLLSGRFPPLEGGGSQSDGSPTKEGGGGGHHKNIPATVNQLSHPEVPTGTRTRSLGPPSNAHTHTPKRSFFTSLTHACAPLLSVPPTCVHQSQYCHCLTAALSIAPACPMVARLAPDGAPVTSHKRPRTLRPRP